jgi:uncharacterized protein YndB with AHSA1/START domain
VWSVLRDNDHWQDWFPALRAVRVVEPGDEDGVGAVLEATVRGRLPYALVFRVRITEVEAPRLLVLTSVGDLEGTGRGTLAEEAGVTTVRFEWRVTTTKAWMNALAPAARPAFGWNHHRVMTGAAPRLADRLGVRLLANESGPVEPDRSTLAAAAVVGVLVLTAAAIAVRRRVDRG